MKKIIAREGLMLLGFVVLGLVVYYIGNHLNSTYLIQNQHAKVKVIENMRYSLIGYTPYVTIKSFGSGLAIFGYPLFALTRFILWAIKVIKEK